MPRNVWNDIVSWRTKRLNNSTKYQFHALMAINSKKKNRNPWDNCQKYALKLLPPPRALPSVIVDTEKVLREADGSVKLVVVRPHTDGKVFAPGCASRTGR